MSQPYRDDQDALETRLTALEQELEAVRARRQELDEAVRLEGKLDEEAAALRRRLSHMRARRALPLLESLKVASPCKADWNAMLGDDKVRFCLSCEKNVYDLGGMTRDEAEAFVREREGGGACIRLHKRRDGTVLTSDCSVGVRNARVRRIGAAALGASLVGAGAALFGATTTTMGDMEPLVQTGQVTIDQHEQVVMGEMAVHEENPGEPSAEPPKAPPPKQVAVPVKGKPAAKR